MVYEGDSNTSPMLGKYCGSTLPPNHVSLSNELLIVFETDQSISLTGFYLEYNALHSLIGDGVCNDEKNNAENHFDGGDCCGYNIDTTLCSECVCHHGETCEAGFHTWVGDGYCNDETNNFECSFDTVK